MNTTVSAVVRDGFFGYAHQSIEIGLVCVIAAMLVVMVSLVIVLIKQKGPLTKKSVKSFQVLHRLSQLQHNPINKRAASRTNSVSSVESSSAELNTSKQFDEFYNPGGINA